jgi:predicted HicB family RNase H-like nuclease
VATNPAAVSAPDHHDAVHGTREDGASITDEAAEAMADEAEQGYVEAIQRCRGQRPPTGSSASSVESVRLDPELNRELLLRAAKEHISL